MNENYLTLCPHVMKLCRLTQKMYLTDARWTKTSPNRSPSPLTNFLNIDRVIDRIQLGSATGKYILFRAGQLDFINDLSMLRIGSADMGNYLETFLSVLCYFLLVIFEVMYVGLVHYSFVTLRRNYSHLIIEHICYIS